MWFGWLAETRLFIGKFAKCNCIGQLATLFIATKTLEVDGFVDNDLFKIFLAWVLSVILQALIGGLIMGFMLGLLFLVSLFWEISCLMLLW